MLSSVLDTWRLRCAGDTRRTDSPNYWLGGELSSTGGFPGAQYCKNPFCKEPIYTWEWGKLLECFCQVISFSKGHFRSSASVHTTHFNFTVYWKELNSQT